MWNNNQLHNWKLHPIFEDLHHLKLHSGMQLTIKAVPNLILAETKQMALAASHHFVSIYSSSSNSCM